MDDGHSVLLEPLDDLRLEVVEAVELRVVLAEALRVATWS
jgi:hypothetical protein